MEKYVNVYLSNNIHKSSGIYDSSVFQDCVYVKKSEKRTDKVLFWSYNYDQEVKGLTDVPIICERLEDGSLKDIITGEIITSLGEYEDEERCLYQMFLTYNRLNELSISKVAEIIKKYFDGPYKQENIARYRQMMEDVRIESANMTYRRIGRKKEQQQKTEQDDEYVRRFINNLR